VPDCEDLGIGGMSLLLSHSRFSPTPAVSVLSRRQPTHIVKQPKKLQSHRQLKGPSATGIPLNFKLKKAVSCREIG